ncbi:LuxR C-terminal-related transcriptional regulator [Mycobacterium sp. CVI_P3]|uniref:LuxR C-terminal-related transcriptional regulator n=1 Tax=Mycobacterium pinniadriaticum TaxID=2994102 RepID=A0ABT3SL11_9MYCO|nr:LuxR family transcriptional regulator [Mycobacterium pinniadriaticum]MCX2933651.1 LuxR C-terminal-related transcriptional regulator [Mycobacterium pinniadriaticum]MCX2940062.1 LuxR C-terminal-related transcriptional regulator [Mycobacterium pinniadriaticum]
MRLSWPLIGRTRQLRAIGSAIAAPDIAGVVVTGVAGVGKSRIAREALSSAESRSLEGRWVVGASSARSIPLGAFTAWTQPGATETVQLVRGVIDALTATTSGARVVVAVDDAHLLDELSIFVVHQLVQRNAARVVLTVRDGEPILPALQEIWTLGQFERLDIHPLSLEETSALLSTTLGGTVEPASTQRLWKLTGGNALYLRNIVEQEVADGRLIQQRDVWSWSGDPVLPADLIGLVESRIGTLPAPVGDVVDILAVAEPLDLNTLTRITDPAAVEEAEVRNLITLEPGGVTVQDRVAHPIYGEVRRRRASVTRLRRLRGLVAAELARSIDADDIRGVVKRAALCMESDLAPDPDLFVRAAHGAVWLADLQLADRLAGAAIAANAGPEPNFIRAHALSWLSRGEEADAVLNRITDDQLNDVDRARLAFLRASNMLWALGDPARALEIIDDAAGIATPQASGYLDAFRTVHAFAMDNPHAAEQTAKKLALADLPPVVGAEIAWALTVVSGEAGHTAEAEAHAQAGYQAATRRFDAPQMRFNIADGHLTALLLAGRVGDAGVVADDVRGQAADLPGEAQLLGSAVAGRADLAAGNLGSACRLLKQSALGLSSAGHAMGWGFRYSVVLATALAMHGDSAEAAAVIAELDGVRRPFRSLDYEQNLARAWLAASQGAISEAVRDCLSAAERAAHNGQFAAEVLCLQTATQFGDRTCASRLAELESIVEGPRVGLAARFAAALRDGDARELAAISEGFEGIGDRVAAVDAAAHAALAHRRHDQRGSALGCSTRATTLAERCGGLVTPALREAAEPLPLTEREREMAMLVGQGLSNRAIAERLTLSPRTVESHILRAMRKTGTNSRDELAALVTKPR